MRHCPVCCTYVMRPPTVSMGIPTWTKGIVWLLRVELKAKGRISPEPDWKHDSCFYLSFRVTMKWARDSSDVFLSLFPWCKILKLAQSQAKLWGDSEFQSLEKRLRRPDQCWQLQMTPNAPRMDPQSKSLWQSQNSSQILRGYPINRYKNHFIDIVSGIFWLYATAVII